MRVLILGGTRFIGRHITEQMVSRGDEVVVVHRGLADPGDWVPVRHVHVNRAEFHRVADEVRDFRPDAVVDTLAMTRADAEAVLPYLPDVPLILLSSMDVYRGYELAVSGRHGVPVPIDENSPLREGRYPHRGVHPGMDGYDIDMDAYDKLDVEPLYLERGATVLRLGMVYGAWDPQRREEPVLGRLRAGRRRIPIGTGNWLWSRVAVDDVASAVLAALDGDAARGEVCNIAESGTVTFRDWLGQIIDASGIAAELVEVADNRLPADLIATGAIAQHLLCSNEKARRLFDWTPGDPASAVARSVRWHLAHPPTTTADYTADDAVLAGDQDDTPPS